MATRSDGLDERALCRSFVRSEPLYLEARMPPSPEDAEIIG
jgi:hypothetical protein